MHRLLTLCAAFTLIASGAAGAQAAMKGEPKAGSDTPSRIAGEPRRAGAELELVRSDERAEEVRGALARFGGVVNQALQDFDVPGAALAVVAADEVIFAQGFGYRDLEAGLPMTPDTLFPIGSTTKAMVATVLGMLVDEGKLDWDEPLQRYLPAFRLSDPIIAERITPRDLVTHRSGLPRHDLLWHNNNESSRAEIVDRLAYLELSADLRQRFQYNNLMYMTAGFLAGQLSGKTWEEVTRERLFEPLGMVRSNFAVAESKKDEDFAYPYHENDQHQIERIPFRPLDLIGPAGAVNSSVDEMSRWVLFNLGDGRVGESQLISPTTLADIQSPHMTTGETPERPEISQATYGMGWRIDTYRGHRRVSHGGGIDGFVTSVMLFPDADLGLVSFNNGESGISSLLNQHIADLVFGQEPIDWLGEALDRRRKGLEVEDEAKERKEATRIADAPPSHPRADYAGHYHHPGYGSLRIALAGDDLELAYNGIIASLEHWHYDVWNGAQTEGDETFEDMKLLFRSDLDGNIAAVEAALEPRAAPIVFEKRPASELFDPEHLRRFAGTYAGATQSNLVVGLSGAVLTLTVPGQPTYTLEPDLSGRFVLKEVRIISLEFVLDESGEVAKLLFHQPGRVFEAEKVK